MSLNHLASELKSLNYRLFETELYLKPNSLHTYTRHGEHNSCVWLYGHIGWIADQMILRPWNEHEQHRHINDLNFGFTSNGKTDLTVSMAEVMREVKGIFLSGITHLSDDNAEHYLRSQSSLPAHCESDLHLVVHAIHDIAYHCGQLNYILTGKTLS